MAKGTFESRVRLWFCIALVPGAVSSLNPQDSVRGVAWRDYFADAETFFKNDMRLGGVRKIALPIDGTIEERGLALREILRSWKGCQHESIHVLAHSQGGLDVRYAIRTLRMKVASLVTVGTPHQGSPYADWAIRAMDGRSWSYLFLKWIGRYDLAALPFAREMSPEFLRSRSSAFADAGDVPSAFVAADCTENDRFNCGWRFRLLRAFTGVAVDGDGFVGSASQHWGQELAHVNLSHWTEIAGGGKESAALRKAFHEKVLNYWLSLAPRTKP